jgi:hypothetical protein
MSPGQARLPSVEQGQITVEELQGLLAGTRAFVRGALQEVDGRWQLRYVEAVIGSQPPRWRADLWRYEGAIFVAEEIAGEQLARALDPETEGTLELSGSEACVRPIGQSISWRRHPSRVRQVLAPLPWPTIDYDLYGQGGNELQPPSGMLIGQDCPSFPGFDTAFRAFFYGDFSLTSMLQVPHSLGRLRLVQLSAWLRRVRLTPSHVDVWVSGDMAGGTRVELNGATYDAAKIVGRTGKVRLRLPEGLPDDAWLYLSNERRWLDYRPLGPRVASQADLIQAGVEVEIPDDPETQIEALLTLGEGPQIEYKLTLPGRTEDEKRKVLKTVAAFANGWGGSIVFGMDPDEVTRVGIMDVGAQSARDRLGNLIRGNVVPPNPDFHVRWATVEGKLFIVLDVDRSASRPYGLRFQDKPVEFYTRRGASTYAATAEEVRDIALSTAPAPRGNRLSQLFEHG